MLRVIHMLPPDLSATLLDHAVPAIWALPEIRIDPADARHVIGLTGRPELPALVSVDAGDTWAGGTARNAAQPTAWGPVAGLSPTARAELGRQAGISPLGDDLAAAADPRDPANVYLAWVESGVDPGVDPGVAPKEAPMEARGSDVDSRLCLRHTRDGGSTWSPNLRIVPQARGAALAVNDRGEVALVYRQLTGRPPDQRWVVYLEHSTNGFITMAQWVLADMPVIPPELGGAEFGGPVAAATGQRVVAVAAEAFYGAFVADGGAAGPYVPHGLVSDNYAGLDAMRLREPAGSDRGPSARDPFFFRFSATV